MPRLLLFAPCQKAILDKYEGTVSLVGLVNGISVGSIEGSEVDQNAVLPYSWTAVSAWSRLSEDEGKQYEDRVEILSPTGDVLSTSTIPFSMTLRVHQNLHNAFGFPVGEPGIYTIRLSMHETTEGSPWKTVAEYPIEIIHKLIDATQMVTVAVPPA